VKQRRMIVMGYDLTQHEYIYNNFESNEYKIYIDAIERQKKELSKLENAFTRLLRMRLRDNRNAIVFVTGEPGAGKSYSAISLAKAVDPDFTLDRVVFDPKKYMDFLDVSKNALPKYSAIIFDDAGVTENARDWQKQQVKILGYLSQTMRMLNYLVIFTTPLATFIEKQTRSLITYELVASKSYINPITVDINDVRGEFKLYEFTSGLKLGSADFVSYRRFVQIPLLGQWANLKYVIITKPKKEICEEYEKKKLEFLKEKYAEFNEKISQTKDQTKIYTTKKRKINPNSLKNLKPFKNKDISSILSENSQIFSDNNFSENKSNTKVSLKKEKNQSSYINHMEQNDEKNSTKNINNEGE
jgi:hypothetical protein